VLIDEASGIIAGHGRVMAARKLKLRDVPAIRLSHLTEAQKRAYVIADNKLALNAGWDDELLRLEINDLQAVDFDVALTGFSTEEIDFIFKNAHDFKPGTEEEQSRLDKKEPIVCPHCGHAFTR
jgi:ParB-like chromosome segregation protein Spo0J